MRGVCPQRLTVVLIALVQVVRVGAGESSLPRLEIEPAMWYRPARAVVVTDALRAIFTLRSGTDGVSWSAPAFLLPETSDERPVAKAWGLLQRHNAVEARQDMRRTPDGLVLENRMPLPPDRGVVKGPVWKTAARVLLPGAESRFVLEEDISVLRQGRHSLRCFTLDVPPESLERVLFSSQPGDGRDVSGVGTFEARAESVTLKTNRGDITARIAARTSVTLLESLPRVVVSVRETYARCVWFFEALSDGPADYVAAVDVRLHAPAVLEADAESRGGAEP